MDKVTWEQVEKGVAHIAEWTPSYINSIFGIKRGGYVPSVILSHALNLPLVDKPDKNTIIIDDISDSGKTLTKYKEYFTATLYFRKGSLVEPNIWVYEKREGWLLFPWENAKMVEKDEAGYKAKRN